MKVILFTVLMVVVFGSCGSGNRGADTEYTQKWKPARGEYLANISQVLASNQISGCGEFYYRRHISSDGEYLIACTSDGESWNYYLIFTNSNIAQGPIKDEFKPPY